MKHFFEDLKNQSKIVREIMFVLCVIITFSMVGTFWFRSGEEDLFLGLNSDSEKQEQFYSERDKNDENMFSNAGSIWTGLKATMSSAFSVFGSSDVEVGGDSTSGMPHQFPISDNK